MHVYIHVCVRLASLLSCNTQWLYLTLNPDWTGEMDKLLTDAEQYFREHSECPLGVRRTHYRSSLFLLGSTHNGVSFLECEVGEPYVSVFRGVRLQHILNDVVSVRTIEADKIIPEGQCSTDFNTVGNIVCPLYRLDVEAVSIQMVEDAGS